MRIDTHCHTDCSDGNVSIEERIAIVKRCQYDAATITDHDFISNEQVERARRACGDIPFVPGIELSLSHQGSVVHLLGYFIDPGHSALQDHLQSVQDVDRDCTIRLLNYFHTKGVTLDVNELVADSLHTFYSLRLIKKIAATLCKNNSQLCMDIFQEAMQALGMTYADFAPWEVRNAIDLIHSAGGIAVLAHPGGENDPSMKALGFLSHSFELIEKYAGWGLDGVETVTPVHSASQVLFYTQVASQLKLMTTAGSDCHGDDPFLGPALMGKSISIPLNAYESLLEAYQTRRCS